MTDVHALHAAYENMRTTILTSYLQHPGHYNPAYVYAWLNRMPAIGIADHESVFWYWTRIDPSAVLNVRNTVDKFVSSRQLDRLAHDSLSANQNIVNVQDHLMTVLGYFSLKGDYSLEVKQALRTNLPPEKSLVTAFGPEMITFPS